MEYLLVEFSDYNRWSIGWSNPIISDDHFLVSMEVVLC